MGGWGRALAWFGPWPGPGGWLGPAPGPGRRPGTLAGAGGSPGPCRPGPPGRRPGPLPPRAAGFHGFHGLKTTNLGTKKHIPFPPTCWTSTAPKKNNMYDWLSGHTQSSKWRFWITLWHHHVASKFASTSVLRGRSDHHLGGLLCKDACTHACSNPPSDTIFPHSPSSCVHLSSSRVMGCRHNSRVKQLEAQYGG